MIGSELATTVNLLADSKEIIEAIDPSIRDSLDHQYVIDQAKKRLNDRSQHELEAGARHAEELLRHANHNLKRSSLDQLSAGAEQVYLNDPLALIEWFEHFQLGARDDFPNAEPVTYFALLALLCALESIHCNRRAGDLSADLSGDPMKEAYRLNAQHAVSERVDDAKELLAFINGMDFEHIFRRKIASKAGKMRAAKFDTLKAKVLQFTDENCQGMTNRNAARRAYDAFREESDSVLQTDDPMHRLEIWIGKHRREQKKRGGEPS